MKPFGLTTENVPGQKLYKKHLLSASKERFFVCFCFLKKVVQFKNEDAQQDSQYIYMQLITLS